MYANNAIRILDPSSPKKLLSIDNSNVNNYKVFYVGRPSSPRTNHSGHSSSFTPADGRWQSHSPCEGFQEMSRLARQVLIAWLLALYGSVSLCGIGLHALLETGPSHHNHGPSEQKVVTISGVSTHCPLCEFQAQGQLPVVKSRAACRPLVLRHVPLHSALHEGREQHPSSSPRAPPSSVLILV